MNVLRVLIVEDDDVFAAAIEGVLIDAGVTVVGRANSVAAALRVVATQTLDVACLDINLGHEDSFPVADELLSRAIPFVFVTGRDAKYLPDRHRNQPLVSKADAAVEIVLACRRAAARDIFVVVSGSV